MAAAAAAVVGDGGAGGGSGGGDGVSGASTHIVYNDLFPLSASFYPIIFVMHPYSSANT